MVEMQKQVERYLRKQAMDRNSFTTCGHCQRRVLVLDTGYCGSCESNICSVCHGKHSNEHLVFPPKLLMRDVNWDDVLQTSLINGFKVTKAMLCEHLNDIGKWEPRFRYMKKADLMKKVKLLRSREK